MTSRVRNENAVIIFNKQISENEISKAQMKNEYFFPNEADSEVQATNLNNNIKLQYDLLFIQFRI